MFLGLSAVTLAAAPWQGPDGQATAIAAASKYAEEYRQQLPGIVCEERQVQTLIKPDGRISKTRVLVSDLMFVVTAETWVPHSFRDVISVDGKPVRNRDDRLKKLFLEGKKDAVAQATAIAKESGRYNLGFSRVGNSPLLPLLLLDPHLVSHFRFSLADRTLSFSEQTSPTFLGAGRNGRREDLPAKGTLLLDLPSGAVQSASLTAEGPASPVSTTFTVEYKMEPTIKVMVPAAMTEEYHIVDKPGEDRFEGRSTYSAFRRFQVTVSEKIK